MQIIENDQSIAQLAIQNHPVCLLPPLPYSDYYGLQLLFSPHYLLVVFYLKGNDNFKSD